MTVATVLRSGGDFTAAWVRALHRGLMRHAPPGFRFLVLTDVPDVGIWRVPLQHNWSGWWSKLELFRPDVFDGPVLYMDLDTLPVGPLDELLRYDGPLMALRDFYQPNRMIGSGVMLWTPSDATAAIYEWATTAKYTQAGRLDHVLKQHVRNHIQDAFPGQVVSLKPDVGKVRNETPLGARLVCGHGRPRLSDPAAGWAHDLWKERAA